MEARDIARGIAIGIVKAIGAVIVVAVGVMAAMGAILWLCYRAAS